MLIDNNIVVLRSAPNRAIHIPVAFRMAGIDQYIPHAIIDTGCEYSHISAGAINFGMTASEAKHRLLMFKYTRLSSGSGVEGRAENKDKLLSLLVMINKCKYDCIVKGLSQEQTEVVIHSKFTQDELDYIGNSKFTRFRVPAYNLKLGCMNLGQQYIIISFSSVESINLVGMELLKLLYMQSLILSRDTQLTLLAHRYSKQGIAKALGLSKKILLN